MCTDKKELHKFFENLGKLFYAIASSDNRVDILEFEKLKALVKNHWVDTYPIKDDCGTNIHQIEIVFESLNKEHLDAKTCFDDFVAYKNEREHLFTQRIKRLIMKTANAIAASFSGINKSELIMLAKLDMELKN